MIKLVNNKRMLQICHVAACVCGGRRGGVCMVWHMPCPGYLNLHLWQDKSHWIFFAFPFQGYESCDKGLHQNNKSEDTDEHVNCLLILYLWLYFGWGQNEEFQFIGKTEWWDGGVGGSGGGAIVKLLCVWFKLWLPHFQSGFLLMCIVGDPDEGSSTWVLASNVGNPHWILGS